MTSNNDNNSIMDSLRGAGEACVDAVNVGGLGGERDAGVLQPTPAGIVREQPAATGAAPPPAPPPASQPPPPSR